MKLPAPEEWTKDARCASGEYDPDMWYPDNNDGWAAPRRVCRSCPVRNQCLTAAMEHEADPEVIPSGMWGGLSPKQRNALRRQKRAA